MVRWMKTAVLLLGMALLLSARNGYPLLYGSIGDDLYTAAQGYRALLTMHSFKPAHKSIVDYTAKADGLRKEGLVLDSNSSTRQERKNYIAALRKLSLQKQEIDTMLLRIIGELRMQHRDAELVWLGKNPYPLLRNAALHTSSQSVAANDLNRSEINLQRSFLVLKEELVKARSENSPLAECLNDVTAINYWIIEVEKLRDEQAWCSAYAASEQIVNFERSARKHCGTTEPLYIRWKERSLAYRTTLRQELGNACR